MGKLGFHVAHVAFVRLFWKEKKAHKLNLTFHLPTVKLMRSLVKKSFCLFVCSGMIGISSVGISFSGILTVLRNRWKHLDKTGNVRSYSGVLTDLMTTSLWLRWCKMEIFLKPHEVKSFLMSYLEKRILLLQGVCTPF